MKTLNYLISVRRLEDALPKHLLRLMTHPHHFAVVQLAVVLKEHALYITSSSIDRDINYTYVMYCVMM